MVEPVNQVIETNPSLEKVWGSSALDGLLFDKGIGFLIITPDHRIIDVSDSFCQMLGYDRKKILAGTIEDISHPDDAPLIVSLLTQHQAKGEITEAERRSLTCSGQELWVNIRVESVFDDVSRHLHNLVLLEDITEVKQKKYALLNSQSRLQAISEKFSARVSYVDNNLCYQFINKSFEDYYQISNSEMIGKNICDILPEDKLENGKDQLHLALTGQQVSFSGLAQGANGEKYEELIKLVPEFNEQNEVQGVFILVTELTDLRQAEEHLDKINIKLRKSEENFRHMMEASQDVIIVADYSGKIMFVNSRINQMFGYQEAELIGQGVELLLPEMLREQHKKYREGFQLAPSSKRAMDYKLDIMGLSKKGKYLPIDIDLGETTYNNKPAMIATIRDASFHRKALETSQELAGIIEASGDAVFRVGIDGIIQFWSTGAERLYGYQANEIVGEMVDILVDEPNFSIRHNILGRVLDGEIISHPDSIRLRKDGSIIEVSVSVFPIKNSKGEIVGTASVHRDMSELKQLEAELLHAQKMESAGKMAGGIAHDFNNILTVIQGYCSLISEELPPDSDLLPHTGAIERAAQRASSLTRQLLAFSRKQRIDPKVLEPKELITELTTILGHTLGEDIDLHIELNSLWHIRQDPAQLEQIVLNLAMNARHAMTSGGQLTIATKDVEIRSTILENTSDWVTFAPESIQMGEYLLLTIADTGTGISKDVLERIFEPFYTTKSKGEGTGLGLSVVFGMVTQCGGSIRVETKVGEGTRFLVYLPRVHAEVSSTAADSVSLPMGKGRILIVEDDVDLLNLSKAILDSAGYTVFTASAPSELLESNFSETIDLILSDVIMPGMNGPDFASKWLDTHPEVRFLFMSGYADESVLPYSFDPECLILKPFKAAELIQRVGSALLAEPENSTQLLAQLGLKQTLQSPALITKVERLR